MPSLPHSEYIITMLFDKDYNSLEKACNISAIIC